MAKDLLTRESLTYLLSKLKLWIESLNFVIDEDYTHTDNNYSDEEKSKLDSIPSVTLEDVNNWNSKEDISNKVTFISESSTNVEYPTAKAVYDAIQRDDYDSQYLTLRFNANCPLKFTPRNGYKLFYKLDNNDWEQLTEEINVIGGSKVLLKGDTSEMTSTGRIGSFASYTGNNLVPTRSVDIYGNVMSLLYGDEFRDHLNSMENYTFGNLFLYCKWVRHLNNLILPAINLSANAYAAMFSDCTCITAPKVLPATNIMRGAYSSMFSYTDITEAPDILATAVGERGCEYMFWNCKYLVKAPVLRILTMSESSYASMFLNCTSLKEAPNLIATSLDLNCYSGMFRGCTSLVTAPKLPATSITHYGVYNYMFMGCTALEVAPELPSTNVGTSSTNSAYGGMFSGCTNLKFIKALFTNTPSQTGNSSTFTNSWVYGVAPTGTIVINDDVEWDIEANRGVSGIPVGWKVYKLSEYGLEVRERDLINKADKDLDAVEGNIAIFNSEGNPVDSGKTFPIPYEDLYLTFEIVEDGVVGFSKNIQYSTDDGKTWNESSGYFTLEVHSGEKILWKGNLTPGYLNGIGLFSIMYGQTAAKYNVFGNVMSLLYGDNFKGLKSLEGKDYVFMNLFSSNGIIDASNLILPATTLSNYCYYYMFYNCNSLIKTPKLPATTLVEYCYDAMFRECDSLEVAPELLATTLAYACYYEMFGACYKLKKICLPAETLAPYCYLNMISNQNCVVKLGAVTMADLAFSGWPYRAIVVKKHAEFNGFLGDRVYTESEWEVVRHYELNTINNSISTLNSTLNGYSEELFTFTLADNTTVTKKFLVKNVGV